MNIFIIGVGLIGGSLSIGMQKIFKDAIFFGVDTDESNLEQAIQLGLVQHKSTIDELHKADMVIVSVPVDVSVTLLPQILDNVNEKALVFDVGSTKERICKAVENHKNRNQFLAAHPIAGTEFSGASAAVDKLFDGKVNIICEVEKTSFKLQEKAIEIFNKLGMRIRYMNPVAHDKHIAYVSHLSHISSFMLGKTVMQEEKSERDIFDMAGSGFESTVRLAKSSPDMWTPIFKQNKNNVIDSLDKYIENLTMFKTLLTNDNYHQLHDELAKTNRIKDILKTIKPL